jgi:hypothetical protein
MLTQEQKQFQELGIEQEEGWSIEELWAYSKLHGYSAEAESLSHYIDHQPRYLVLAQFDAGEFDGRDI